MVQLNFDATNVTPAAPPEALETGWYPANIILTEMKPTKNGQGAYLEITHRLSAGPAAGRTFKNRLNLQNANQQAVDIAYAELSAICHAIGRLRIAVAAELHGGALEIYLKKVARNDDPTLMTNDVAGFRAMGAAGSTPGFTGAVGSQTGAAPSWAAQPQQPQAQQPAPQQQFQPQPQQQFQPQAQQPAPQMQQPTPQAAPWQAETPPQQQPAPQQQNFAPQPQVQPTQEAPPSNDGTVPPWAR